MNSHFKPFPEAALSVKGIEQVAKLFLSILQTLKRDWHDKGIVYGGKTPEKIQVATVASDSKEFSYQVQFIPSASSVAKGKPTGIFLNQASNCYAPELGNRVAADESIDIFHVADLWERFFNQERNACENAAAERDLLLLFTSMVNADPQKRPKVDVVIAKLKEIIGDIRNKKTIALASSPFRYFHRATAEGMRRGSFFEEKDKVFFKALSFKAGNWSADVSEFKTSEHKEGQSSCVIKKCSSTNIHEIASVFESLDATRAMLGEVSWVMDLAADDKLYLYLKMPKVEGVDAKDFFLDPKNQTEENIIKLFKAIFIECKRWHDAGFVHGELNLGNIKINVVNDQFIARFIDLDFARREGDFIFGFNIEGMAKETRNRRIPAAFTQDIYRLGYVIHCLSNGYPAIEALRVIATQMVPLMLSDNIQERPNAGALISMLGMVFPQREVGAVALKDFKIPDLKTHVEVSLAVMRSLKILHADSKVYGGNDSSRILLRETKDIHAPLKATFLFDFRMRNLYDPIYVCVSNKDGYHAPELEKGKPADFSHDVFNIGMLLSSMKRESINNPYIIAETKLFKLWATMLQSDHCARPSVDEVVHSLETIRTAICSGQDLKQEEKMAVYFLGKSLSSHGVTFFKGRTLKENHFVRTAEYQAGKIDFKAPASSQRIVKEYVSFSPIEFAGLLESLPASKAMLGETHVWVTPDVRRGLRLFQSMPKINGIALAKLLHKTYDDLWWQRVFLAIFAECKRWHDNGFVHAYLIPDHILIQRDSEKISAQFIAPHYARRKGDYHALIVCSENFPPEMQQKRAIADFQQDIFMLGAVIRFTAIHNSYSDFLKNLDRYFAHFMLCENLIERPSIYQIIQGVNNWLQPPQQQPLTMQKT